MRIDSRVRILVAGMAFLLLAGALFGCSTSGETVTEDISRSSGGSVGGVAPSAGMDLAVTEEYAGEKSTSSEAPTPYGVAQETDRMVIRTQTMRLEVESTPDAVEKIRDLTSANGGAITDLQVATETDDWIYRYDESGYTVGDGAALRGWVTVRVPADSLDAFVEAARALGTVKYQSEGTEDVTQQHVDLSARLSNLRAQEERLRTFFEAAKNVEEMLAVETELNRVRQEIESMDAQVKYLERQAAMATVTIELTEKRPVVRPEGDDWGFRDAITSGFRGAANVMTFAIAFIIATAPLWLVALLAFFVIRAILRHRRAKRAAQPPAAKVDANSDASE